jgi:hypothetical protein
VKSLAVLVLLGLAALSAPGPLSAHPGARSASPRAIEPAPPRGAAVPAPAGTERSPATTPEETTQASSRPPSPGVPGLPIATTLALAALGLAAGRLGGRRTVALLAAVVAVAFAFESGVHSVHHIAEASGATGCAVASAASTVAGVTDAPSTRTAVHAPPSAVPADARPLRLSVAAPAPFQGRAPPRSA